MDALDDAAAEAKAKRREKQDAEDLRWLLSGPRGRRIVFRDLEDAGLFRAVFNTNALSMAFAEGRRNQGLQKLARLMAINPDAYATMVKENQDDDARNFDDAADDRNDD